ncbi:MAG TPA: DUF1801 domain-containing protein [Bacteroidia bacterium]|nr:DUF1801 domain-containing protein [Bacteroidia bacterium]
MDKVKGFKNVDQYISIQAENIRPTLETLRQCIRKAAPGAEEVISYQMPAYKQKGILIYFASFKNHYSFFVRPAHLNAFRKELTSYKTSKSAVNIPLDKKVPLSLVTRIVKYAVEQNENEFALKQVRKKTPKKTVVKSLKPKRKTR